jgi:hypothetical protein
MKKLHLLMAALFVAGGMCLTSCVNDDNKVVNVDAPYVPGIPSDDIATPNPNVPDPNTQLPNFNYTIYEELGYAVIRIDMTGVQDPNTGDWVKLYGPADRSLQNVWVSLDGAPKGFSISNTADDNQNQVKAVDLVFLVDNSGSMDQEADALANQVLAWSQKLAASNLDIKFGLVGYDGSITGGINLGPVEDLDAFLNNGSSGTYRTTHFAAKEGEDWATWRTKYWVDNDIDECGVAALRLADENFAFRAGANRAYVNFTDEANYSKANPLFDVAYVKDINNWPAIKGTIHTVFSEDSTDYWVTGVCNAYPSYYQRPWRLSEYTGGTMKFVPSSFSGVTLDDLPITGALQNSYIIRFTNVQGVLDGQPHRVHITVRSTDGVSVLADKEVEIVFTKQQ